MNIIPIEISGRHIHLNQQDLEILFGSDFKLSVERKLSQTGQYVTPETVSLRNGDLEILNVKIVGPTRPKTQVELAISDAGKLDINPPINKSGEVSDATMITIVGPKNSLVKKCAIIAQRHIHASFEDAKKNNLHDGQIVSVRCGKARAVIFNNVIVRVAENYLWNFHIDVDEANSAGLGKGSFGEVII